jgi:hypothetical protein
MIIAINLLKGGLEKLTNMENETNETVVENSTTTFRKGKSVTEIWAEDYSDPFTCTQDWSF